MNDLVKFIRKIYLHQINGEDTILELSTFQGFPLWWTSDNLFYEFLLRTTYETDNQKLPFNYYRFLNLYKFMGIYLELVYDIFLKITIKIIENVFPQKKKKNAANIFFISQDRQWNYSRNHVTNKLEKNDVFFGPVLEYLGDYNLCGFYPIDLYPLRGLKVFFNKRKVWNINHNPLNKYWSFNSWKNQRLSIKKFKKALELIKSDEDFKKICQHNGKDLYDDIIREFEVYFRVLYPHLIKYIDMAQKMIHEENPDLILLLNEFDYWERSLMLAAKKEGIKTVALQHGVIFPYQRNYMYLPDEISVKNELRCPLTDHTIVYGSFYHHILTSISSYPKDSVLELGQPRYDILYQTPKLYSKTNFRNKYNLPGENKIVLWTMQCFYLSDQENQANFHSVLKAAETLNNTTLIIKPHPLDGYKYYKMLKTISKEYQTKCLFIDDIETLELIYNCDVMITKDSTTALEALALNKPLIILNLSGEKDRVDYVENNVALGVYESENLYDAIENLLNDDMLSSSRKEYIKKYLHQIDGKSSLRISQFIKNIINKR